MTGAGPTGDDVAIEVVVDDRALGRGRVTMLRLGWRRVDPLAVTLLVTARPNHPALPRGRWVVLRDFLRYGLEEPTGDGDVRIFPEPSADRVHLQLARGHRPCTVALSCQTVRDFLDATERIVPGGEEHNDEAIDALIDRLLRD